jgi:hypothetical protein
LRGVAAAHDVLLEMAEEMYAFLRPEAEARASEARWKGQPREIQPHRLGAALQQLIHQGRLSADHEVTRGGRRITTIRKANLANRERLTADAAARKRLLYARYLSWASGSPSEPGLIGPAAESMLHLTLRNASPERGYQLENSVSGNTASVLGMEVPGGPLDNAAHVYLGNPARRYSAVIEVKSRREWMYQTATEIYQVLFKASVLQQSLPEARIVPVLVCRRAHITAFRMFKDLGGYVIEIRDQWLPTPHSRVDPDEFLEVRNELHFLDLHRAPEAGIHSYLGRHLATYLPRALPEQAERWATAGCRFIAEYEAIWREEPLIHLARIRERMRGTPWFRGGW